MNWDAIAAISTTIGLIVGSFSAYIAIKNQKENFEWNKKKTSEETLRNLVDGKFTQVIDDIQEHYSWNIIGEDKTYAAITESMEPARKMLLDNMLRTVLRVLEIVSIHIKHNIINEELCYEYLASIGPQIYKKIHSFIETEREERGEPRIFCEYEKLMKEWLIKNSDIR